MPVYDYEEAIRSIKEYSEREKEEERRGPTQPHEFYEVEEWSVRAKDYFKNNLKRVPIELTEEDVNRIIGTLITPKQMEWHMKHDIVVNTDEIVGFEGGRDELECYHPEKGRKRGKNLCALVSISK